jgi:hypothetical protein
MVRKGKYGEEKVVRARITVEELEELKQKLALYNGLYKKELTISQYLRWCVKNFDVLIEIKEGKSNGNGNID